MIETFHKDPFVGNIFMLGSTLVRSQVLKGVYNLIMKMLRNPKDLLLPLIPQFPAYHNLINHQSTPVRLVVF